MLKFNNFQLTIPDNLKFGKTQITLVLEDFRTNQAHHSNRLGETDIFGEKKIEKFPLYYGAIFFEFSQISPKCSFFDFFSQKCLQTFSGAV